MAVDVEELVLTPFREVVARGQDAAANAEAEAEDASLASRMTKASQSVIREGERALKRLQPQWDAHVAKYGELFKETIRDNDEIAEKRRSLEDLLYDFEDYIEPDSFEVEKFTELQAATKSFALDVLDIIRRLKIDPGVQSMTSPGLSDSAPHSPTSFPPLPPLPPSRNGQLPRGRNFSNDSLSTSGGSMRGSTVGFGMVSPVDHVRSPPQFATSPLSRPPAGGSETHTGLGLYGARPPSTGSRHQSQRTSNLHRTATTSSRASSFYHTDPPPPPPQAPLPQLPQRAQTGTTSAFGAPRGSTSPDAVADEFERVRLNSEASGKSTHESFLATPSTLTASPRTLGWVSDQSAAQVPPLPPAPPSSRFNYPSPSRGQSMAAFRAGNVDSPILHDSTFQVRAQSYHASNTHQDSAGMSHHGAVGTFYDDPNTTSPTTTNRGSLFSDHSAASSTSLSHHMIGDKDGLPMALTTVGEVDDGLILADEAHFMSEMNKTWTQERSASSASTAHASLPAPPAGRRPDCLIGPRSTFHQLKGFCRGGESFRRSAHLEGMKKAPSYGENTAVGRCTSCEYYHVYSDISRDLARDTHANLMKYNVFYRLRFIFKSHMLVRSLSEIRYACLFCAQTGHTAREGDATVFETQEQLLRHLSRHPQPLPEVPGVTVLYGNVGQGHPLEEDYDLHFPDPPATTPMPELAFSTLPTATAIKSLTRKPGEKPLQDPDGSENVLRFLAGARIVGVEFPSKWAGNWCVGWHDGVYAAFPFKHVEMDVPKPSEVSHNPNSSVTVTARWKWSPKDNSNEAGWLPLEKGESIRTVGWVYQDHWCWHGTNNKGKSGVFPSSHIDPISVREGQPAPTSKAPSIKSVKTTSGLKQSTAVKGLMGRRTIHNGRAKDTALSWEGVASQIKFPGQPAK